MNQGKEEDQSIGILTLDGQPHEISELGSLGLLAIGYKGLLAWRAKRKLVEQAARDAQDIS